MTPGPRRERIEAELEPPELGGIYELASSLDVPFRAWAQHPAFKSWVLLAAARRARRYQRAGRKATPAWEEAAIALGLSPDGIVRGRLRWRGDKVSEAAPEDGRSLDLSERMEGSVGMMNEKELDLRIRGTAARRAELADEIAGARLDRMPAAVVARLRAERAEADTEFEELCGMAALARERQAAGEFTVTV